MIDSQSVKTTESGGPRGFDAGKKIKGRKRHILTDTSGLLVTAIVHSAGIQDRDGAPAVLASIRQSFPWLRHVFADGGYAGKKLRGALTKIGNIALAVYAAIGSPEKQRAGTLPLVEGSALHAVAQQPEMGSNVELTLLPNG